jgi:hypothetical protein
MSGASGTASSARRRSHAARGYIERGVAPFLVSPDWEPLYPMQRYGVYASRWPLGEETVWTIVNRNEYDVAGRQIDVPLTPGMRYFDLYHGKWLWRDSGDARGAQRGD